MSGYSSFGLGRVLKRDYDRYHASVRPQLYNHPGLFVFTDYSGQEKTKRYDVYTILIIGERSLLPWMVDTSPIRISILRNQRRVSFKGLSDRQQREAVNPLLAATNALPGICASFAVRKSDLSLFGGEKEIDLEPIRAYVPFWKRKTLLRAITIAHLVGFLVSGIAVKWQNLFWVSDADEIAHNDEQTVAFTQLSMLVISSYLEEPLGHYKFGTTRTGVAQIQIEDLLSVADLYAGAVSDVLANSHFDWMMQNKTMTIPFANRIKAKTKLIMAHYLKRRANLEKDAHVVWSSAGPNKIMAQRLAFSAIPR